jgi:phosphoribosyl 1,2-cyclic phosphodiesterase
MRYCCLSSGSKQNCFYLETAQTAILIDIGLSFRALRTMLAQLHRSIDAIRAVFITHEHSDHIRGLATFANKTRIPI